MASTPTHEHTLLHASCNSTPARPVSRGRRLFGCSGPTSRRRTAARRSAVEARMYPCKSHRLQASAPNAHRGTCPRAGREVRILRYHEQGFCSPLCHVPCLAQTVKTHRRSSVRCPAGGKHRPLPKQFQSRRATGARRQSWSTRLHSDNLRWDLGFLKVRALLRCYCSR